MRCGQGLFAAIERHGLEKLGYFEFSYFFQPEVGDEKVVALNMKFISFVAIFEDLSKDLPDKLQDLALRHSLARCEFI